MTEPAIGKEGRADWRSLGACRHEDPELFFPISRGPGVAQLEQAKAVCARCPVQAECLSFAVESVQDHGVWGGTSEEERRALRRARRRRELRLLARHGQPAGRRQAVSSGPVGRRAQPG